MTTPRRVLALFSALFLLPLMAVTNGGPAASAADGSLFQPLPGFRPDSSAAVSARPTRFRAYRADLPGIRARLTSSRTTTLSIPDPAGTPTEFTVAEDSVLAPALQAAHPEIRTYTGAAPNGTTIRLDVTPFGFHAMVRRPDGVSWYVEPATRTVGEDRVLTFAGFAAGDAPTLVEQDVRDAAHEVAPAVDPDFSTPGGLVTQRVYRLALINDPAYADYITGGDTNHATADPLVLAAKVSLINRVDEVYNDDVAYKFVLIPGTDTKLNLLTTSEMSGANGPCGPHACFPDATGDYDCFSVLDRNDFVLGQLVGADTYDIGHIALGVNGGGVAGLRVVGDADKGTGCTGVPTPVGDLYAIDYVAHEMGHQMGGNHPFNGTQGACGGGNRNGPTSVEPGSGVTIMAYAGICDSDDLQPHSDPYFSFKSIDEFEATTAEARSPLAEQQSVNLTSFNGTDAFTISCAGCGTSSTITNGSTYNTAGLSAAVLAATGEPATVTGYDGAATPSAAGFTVTWQTAAGDEPRLVITPTSGTFTTSTGVLVQGGPQGNHGATNATADHSPVVAAPADKTIPTRTPFTLTGSATDADAGDTLTYQWEQTDSGVGAGTRLVSNTKTNGPLFRVFGTYADVDSTGTLQYHSPGENLAGIDPSRTFPDLQQILDGNTNAKTGTCPTPLAPGTVPVTDPALNCFSEYLPTSAWVGTGNHVMHFRLTARDEFTPDPGADHPGGVTWDDLALTVEPTAGPFLVTSRGTAGPTASGAENVTWDVAGTNTTTMAQNVRLSLSTDGGLTYPITLAVSTPNDGSQTVTLPNVTTSTARLKVEAVGNYFFDVNDADFSITPAGTDLAPFVDAGRDGTVLVNRAFSSSGSFFDETPGTHTATVDYGEGAGDQPLTLTGTTFTLNHTYATSGTKTVTVKVRDAAGHVGEDTAVVTVNPAANSAPTVNAGPDAAVAVGATFSSAGSFTDDNPAGASATVDYGDGAGPTPLTLSGTSFSLSHVYTSAGTRTVTVTVTDADRNSGSDTATVTVTGSPPTMTPSTTDAAAKHKRVTRGHGFKVNATVTTSSGIPDGTVQVYLGSKLLGTGTLQNGEVTIKVSRRKARKLEPGKNTLTARYLGSTTVLASQDSFKVRIVRKH